MAEKVSSEARLLGQILVYVRALAISSVKQRAHQILDSKEKARVYSMLDGETPISEIRKSTRIAKSTISDWQLVFVSEGLASPPNESDRNNKALFTLTELGISSRHLKGASR